MANHNQFCTKNETKLLAQKTVGEHEGWLKEKVDAAFARLHGEESAYLTLRQAEERMDEFKAKIRAENHFE